ncbi:MAG: EamA/RhaT family transporter, partial [Thermoproteus sp.]
MDTRLNKAGAIGKILAAATLWSTIGLASVYSGDYVVLAFFRSLIASAIALFFVRSRKKSAVVSGVLLGILFTVYPLAAALVGLGPAAYLLYTAPLWTTLTSSLLGERARHRDFAAVFLILIAVALMVLGASLGALNLFGFMAGLASGVSYGSYIAVARCYSKDNRDLEVSLGAMPYTLAVTTPAVMIYISIYGPGDLIKTAAFGA